MHILYLHGFMSSPQSEKAQETLSYLKKTHPTYTLHTPQLSNFPSQIEAQLLALIEQTPELLAGGLRVIGSSMGGYIATWLVEKFGGKGVLVNPAVRPYELLRGYLGNHVNPYTGEAFTLVEQDMAIIKALDTPLLSRPDAFRVMLQTADETLDYRQAETKYKHSDLVIEEGGDHRFVNYHEHLPQLIAFLR